MKTNLLSILFIGSIAITSCSKKGCIDENATNYTEEAKKDDGSCVYPTKVEIKTIEALTYPTVNSIGDSWDNPGDADCYIKIASGDGSPLYQSQYYINPESTITWHIDPIIVFNDIVNSTGIIISMYDEDGTIDDEMGEVSINLYDYTQNGANPIKYPSEIAITDSQFSYKVGVVWK